MGNPAGDLQWYVLKMVEEPFEMVSNNKARFNSEEDSEEQSEQNVLEQHSELSWSLQEWINHDHQSQTTETQLHMNQEQLKQLHANKLRLEEEADVPQEEQTKCTSNSTSDYIKSKMKNDQDN